MSINIRELCKQATDAAGVLIICCLQSSDNFDHLRGIAMFIIAQFSTT